LTSNGLHGVIFQEVELYMINCLTVDHRVVIVGVICEGRDTGLKLANIQYEVFCKIKKKIKK
jgi:hypothetical protein